MITGSGERQHFCPIRPGTGLGPVTIPIRYRKLSSSFNGSLYSDVVYRELTRRERSRSIPLDRFSVLNAWAEIPRMVHAEEGSADEAQLRTWLNEGWLTAMDLVELDILFGEQLHSLALGRKRRRARMAWVVGLYLVTLAGGCWLYRSISLP